jgi:hypothetical protein
LIIGVGREKPAWHPFHGYPELIFKRTAADGIAAAYLFGAYMGPDGNVLSLDEPEFLPQLIRDCKCNGDAVVRFTTDISYP